MSNERPSRAYVMGVYAKRIMRWQRTSTPFLTVDAFAEFADFRFNPVSWRISELNSKAINAAEIVFCKGEELEPMLQAYPNLSAKVIICGNSDYEFHAIPNKLPSSVRAIFLQNSFISDNQRIFTLPIGIENLRWGVNGHPKLLKQVFPRTLSDKVLFGPFGDTHPLRNAVFREFSDNPGPWEVLPPKRISGSDYAAIAQRYRFIAAVRGNGVDTHRLWESFYRGVLPIIQKDSWSCSLDYLDLPVIKINEWTATELLNVYGSFPRMQFNPLNYDSLWMPYWEKKIRSFLF